jgi:hypothetical protein
VQEYQSSDNKLIRKIKSGSIDDDDGDDDNVDDTATSTKASLFVTSAHVIVRTKDHGIRIMEKESGKKVGKVKIKSTASSQPSCSMTVANHILATIEDDHVVLYDINTCNKILRIPPTNTNIGSNLQLVSHGEEDRHTLLVDDVLYSINKNQYEKWTQFVSLEENPTALFLSNAKVLALMYQRGGECVAQWISVNEHGDLPDKFRLGQTEETESKNVDDKKRKTAASQILGPGQQAGIEPSTIVKKMKMSNNDDEEDDDEDMKDKEEDDEDEDEDGEKEKDDDNEEDDEANNMTIAERLQMLQDALDREAQDEDDDEDDDDEEGVDLVTADKKTILFKPRTATTESLKELLTQALQSSDDSLLELALMVRDPKIISTTIREIDQELLVVLLGKLTSRLASTPLRAEALSVWISQCLKKGTYDPQHLAVLRNLLYERIESFSDLLRLEGRLSMMVED